MVWGMSQNTFFCIEALRNLVFATTTLLLFFSKRIKCFQNISPHQMCCQKSPPPKKKPTAPLLQFQWMVPY